MASLASGFHDPADGLRLSPRMAQRALGQSSLHALLPMVCPKGQRPHIHECPTNFPKISEQFGTLFEKWLEVRNTYGPGVYLYLSTRRGMQLYAESQFTLLVTGLETFHRTKYGDVSPPRATAKVDRIVSQITAARDRTWAKTQLTGAILPRLEARIFEAINALLLGFDEGRLKRFARDCAKLRNDLAHYGGDRDRAMPYTDFVSLVMKKNNALRPLCHALVLTEIGLDPAEVRAWAGRKRPGFPEELVLRRGRSDRPCRPKRSIGKGEDCFAHRKGVREPAAMTGITLDDILQTANEPVSDLPLKTIIDAYFDGTKHMQDFSREVMIPQLKALLGPTVRRSRFGIPSSKCICSSAPRSR